MSTPPVPPPDEIDWRARMDAAAAGEAAVPPPERQLTEIEKAAALVSWQCPHCVADLHVDAWRDGLPVAVGVTHQKGCPDWLPDWPA